MADPWWLRAHGHLGSHSREIHRRRFDGDGNAVGVRVPAAPALLKLNPPLPKCPSAIAMHTHPYLAVGVEMEGVLDDWIHLLQHFPAPIFVLGRVYLLEHGSSFHLMQVKSPPCAALPSAPTFPWQVSPHTQGRKPCLIWLWRVHLPRPSQPFTEK